jgi:hypothetical protein
MNAHPSKAHIKEVLEYYDIPPDKRPFIQRVIKNSSEIIGLLRKRRAMRLSRRVTELWPSGLSKALEIAQEIKHESPDNEGKIGQAIDGLSYIIETLGHIKNGEDISETAAADFSTPLRIVKEGRTGPRDEDVLKAAVLHIGMVLQNHNPIFLELEDFKKDDTAAALVAAIFYNDKNKPTIAMQQIKYFGFVSYRHEAGIGLLHNMPETATGYKWIDSYSIQRLYEPFGSDALFYDLDELL